MLSILTEKSCFTKFKGITRLNCNLNVLTSNFMFSLVQGQYEELLHYSIKSAHVIVQDDYLRNCSGRKGHKELRLDSRADSNVVYIAMTSAKDYDVWLQFAKCFQIWDLDARGFHRGMWRFTYKEVNLFIVGVPYSPYR